MKTGKHLQCERRTTLQAMKPRQENKEMKQRKSVPRQVDIKKLLTPVLICLKIFGLYHDVDESNSVEVYPVSNDNDFGSTLISRSARSDTKTCTSSKSVLKTTHESQTSPTPTSSWTATKKRRNVLAGRCYCTFVTLILFANTAKVVLSMFSTDSLSLGFRIVLLIFLAGNSCGAACLLVACWRKTQLGAFYKQWSDLFTDLASVELGIEPDGCRMAMLVFPVVAIGFMVVNITGALAMIFNGDAGLRDILCSPFPVNTLSLTYAVILHVMNTAAWTIPVAFITCTTHLITKQFKLLTKTICVHIKASDGAIPPKMKELRKFHLKLCNILSVLDRFLKVYVAFLYLSTLVSSCFILYQLISIESDAVVLGMNLFWLISSVLIATATSISLSNVHEAILGVYVTYFFLLLQFRI